MKREQIGYFLPPRRKNMEQYKDMYSLPFLIILFLKSIYVTKIQVLSKFQPKLRYNTAIISKTIENNRKMYNIRNICTFYLF